MKPYHIIWMILFCASNAFGQFNFKTAKEESGIIYGGPSNRLNIGYANSTSEARFAASGEYSLMVDSTRNLFRGYNFKLTIPITDGTSAFYSGGSFTPGIGAAYEYIWNNNEFSNTTKYYFLRAGYNIKQNKFGRVLPSDSIVVDKRFTNTFTLAGGVQIVGSDRKNKGTDNFIVGLSLNAQYHIEPTVDLKTSEYSIYSRVALNGVVHRNEKAYNARQEDFFALIPKIDIAWTPWMPRGEDGKEIGTRFGLISSTSTRYNATSGKFAWNFGIGPSLHPKWSTSNVIATVQAEFIDFTNSAGGKKFDDIFAINFYVGIPLSFK